MLLIAIAAGLVLKAEITVGRRDVRLGQLVRAVDGQGLSGAEASRVVLRLPAGARHWEWPAPALVRLVERRLSGRSVTGHGRIGITLATPASTRGRAPCWTTVHAIPAGASITSRDVTTTDCRGAAIAGALAFGVDHGPSAAIDLPAGARLGLLLPARPGRVGSAMPLSLRAAMGPVVIERPVTTLQPGRSGRRVFVRDAEGHVFTAALTLAEGTR